MGTSVESTTITKYFTGKEHPGIALRKILLDLSLNESEVADGSRLSRPLISAILNGKRNITARSSLLLGEYLDVEPEIFIEAQTKYEQELERRKVGDVLKEVRSYKTKN